jgi:hypothetical protein
MKFHSSEMRGMQPGKQLKEIEEFACFLSKEPSTLWDFYLDLVRNQAEMYKGLRDAIRLEAARDSE